MSDLFSMDTLIKTFLDTYESENTRRRYKAVLLDFSDFVGGNLLKVDSEDIFDYHDYLKKKPGQKPRGDGDEKYSGRTIRNAFEILNSFYRFTHKRLKTKLNPVDVADIKLPKYHFNEKRPTKAAEFDAVMRFCNAPSRRTKKGIRDRAILACLFGGGLRKSEVIKLKLRDVMINGDDLYLTLRNTKAGKTEHQALPKWTADRVTRLVEVRNTEGAQNSDYLMVNYRRKRNVITSEIPQSGQMPIRTFDRIFHRWRDEVGLDKDISPHSARATGIKRLIALGVPIREVQLFFRHASVMTTEIYDRRYFGTGRKEAEKLSY